MNHTNVGAIFRSAAALGIDAVLVTQACYDPLYRRAVRVSMGTVFQVPWARIGADSGATGAGSWAHDGIPLLHSLGFKTAALALSDDSVSIDDPQLASEERLALVLGTEGDGLAFSTIANCDYTVRSRRTGSTAPSTWCIKPSCLLGTESKVANRCFSDP